jgi:hypothetical protein
MQATAHKGISMTCSSITTVSQTQTRPREEEKTGEMEARRVSVIPVERERGRI